MERSNKICLIVIITCTILVIGICVYAIYNRDDVQSDAEKFKNEYEVYNGVAIDDSEEIYLDVNISSTNPIIYKTAKEIVEIMETDTAFVYFGYPSSQEARSIIETLLEVAEEESIETIYYVNIYSIRDTYVYNGSLTPEQTVEGTQGYYDILDFLGDNLSEYYVTDSTGVFRYDTGVTRLNAPTVVAVQGGEVVGFHEGTVDDKDTTRIELTDEEKETLKEIYKTLFQSVTTTDNTCSDKAC